MENQLRHLDQFHTVLSSYQVSAHSKQILTNTQFILMLGPSSSGRNTIIKELVASEHYYFVISDTTRHPRKNNGVLEKNGKEYWFVSEQEMLAGLKKGEYVEAEVIHEQQVSGISIRELEKARDASKIAVTDVDVYGVYNIKAAKPDAVCILLLPPSFEEWQHRLVSRGEMTIKEKIRRMQTAEKVFTAGIEQEYFHFLVTEDVSSNVEKVHKIMQGKVDEAEFLEAKKLNQKLLLQTQDWLKENS